MRDIGSSIKILCGAYTLYIVSRIYFTVRKAHTREIYNTVEYNDCTINESERYNKE